MLPWRELDDLLRGRRTSTDALREGAAGLRLTALVPMAVVLAAIYGLSGPAQVGECSEVELDW